MTTATTGDLSDVALVRAAQAGDVGCLGLLLARHTAAMRAVALSVCGHRPEAEDAVQEASLIALRRIGDLRDPAAVGPWLRTIVRNVGRLQFRAQREVPVDQLELVASPAVGSDLERIVERTAHADWLWTAMHELSPNLRLVTMLRYFTDVTAYDQIAALCGVPIGTVRSRLHQARAKLTDALLATADAVHDDVAVLTRRRRAEAEEMLWSGRHGSFARTLAETWSPAVQTWWSDGRRTNGIDPLARTMYADVHDGVVYRLANIVAARDVVILETDLINPPEDPFHCPPSAVWVQSLEADRVSRLRVFHPDRAKVR
ncbi:sigma-70 family RNA polymerase sigma factor [Verrucosispora sp. ts21]|uniref:RNA polymerase sigma factor n=1 Tax=Verrucosispora sp. ts21 TaxID=2069341 RepID=UPI000C887943|nr:sigma-70 family RNA polymerase sigma factor [Verrucosispora sp. ts21]PMR58068.1 sigma-70 family RNA polymerase sigma factor [Verrucosispora sp. ts21]